MSEIYILEPSPRSEKKWRITTPWGKKVDFGASGYSDFTIHKDPNRQKNYISRHSSRENWTKTGTETAGFWSRWLLWNLPDLMASIRDTESKFNITIDSSKINTNLSTSVPLQISSNYQNITLPIDLPSSPLTILNPPLSPMTPVSPSLNHIVPMTSLPPLPTLTTYTNLLPSVEKTSLIPMSSLHPVPRSPLSSPRSYQLLPSNGILTSSYRTLDHLPVSTLPASSISLPGSQTYQDVSSNSMIDEYNKCKDEAKDRQSKGKLKLCPEGYCTVKLTENVYPSYWANLKASKICTGQLEDYEGKVEKHYERRK